jgi:hypothetical protein
MLIILDDRIISLRGEGWAHKTSFTPPLFVEVNYQAIKVSGHVSVS